MEGLEGFLRPLLEAYAGNYGWAVSVLAYMGTFRVVFKPLMTGIDAVVAATPSKKDDEKWSRIKAHKAFKITAWVIDFLGSIKIDKLIPKKK